MSRLNVEKTLKQYINGKFVRSESGQVLPLETPNGVIRVASGSRKDLREAIAAARKAQSGWAGRTAYNRGQILYRLGELIDGRSWGLPEGHAESAADRCVHYAGWADKITQVLSTLNPVSGTFVNYSRIRPLGVVVAAPDPADGLLGLVEALCAGAVMGNGTVVLASVEAAEEAVALTECLHTSDWPAGVVNVLTGDVSALLGHASKHDDVDGLYLAGPWADHARAELNTEAARVMRRMLRMPGAGEPASPADLQQLSEVQTVWMSAFEPRGGAAAY